MEQRNREAFFTVMEGFLEEGLLGIVVSNPLGKQGIAKVTVRPLLLKGKICFQAEELAGGQAFHKNLSKEDCIFYLADLLENKFRQLELTSDSGQVRVLVSKKGLWNIKEKRCPKMKAKTAPLPGHDRQKRYLLPEGRPVPFLVDLGVMTAEGKVVKSRYDKFRQINRFLEFIEDVLPALSKDRENVIVDFGCGKSYLTFAMYYYLHEVKGYKVRIIGLDLKQTVIDNCNTLKGIYGYEGLEFLRGDIKDYEGVKRVDMVVTLHACDTATDYAIYKAVSWGAQVILSVPCCQHELNAKIQNDLLAPVLQYGLVKERMAALYTDALRAELLENQGYRTQILEFIDMEHTPKNLLIRAVKQGGKKNNQREIREILEFLHSHQTLAELFLPQTEQKEEVTCHLSIQK